MICITGLETSAQLLTERLARCRDYPLQEVRLDALDGPLPSLETLPVAPENLLVTCRRTADGGLFDGSEPDRLLRLEDAIKWKPAWIDLEADVPETTERHLLERARIFGVKVLRSTHLTGPCEPGIIIKALAHLSTVYGDGIKLAAFVDDLIRLEEFFLAPKTRASVLIGMGPAGLITRALHRRFHSAWTYVSENPWPDPEAGIPDLAQARLWGVPVPKEAPLFALLGNASITLSPGPPVYNQLFRQKAFDGIYLPAITEQLEPAFALLARLNFRGASITIPHKHAAVDLANELGKTARLSGSVNTLVLQPDGTWRGDNTDIPALQAILGRLTDRPIKKSVILGAGGLARACAYALAEKGIQVTVLSRRFPIAEDPWFRAKPFKALPELEFDLLINATPVGAGPADKPLIPESVSLSGKVVLDAVLSSRPTPLLTRASADGAQFAGGLEFWTEQGARQLHLFNAPQAAPKELAALAAECIDQWGK